MAKESQEREVGAEEQAEVQTSEKETDTQTVSKVKDTVSKENQGKEEGSESQESKDTKTYTDEEVQKKVKAEAATLAQSMKDRELKPLYAQLDTATKRIGDLETKAEKEADLVQLAQNEASELKGWKEQGIDEGTIKDFQKEKRVLIEATSKSKEGWKTLEKEKEKIGEDSHRNTALRLAIQYGLENGEEIIKTLGSFIEKIKAGESPAEMELLALKASLQPKEKQEPKKPPAKKIDSSLPSAGGGVDMKNMTPDQKVETGLKKLRK